MASDREALARVLYDADMTEPYTDAEWAVVWPESPDSRMNRRVDAILASDWLRERDRRIRSVVGKEIAEAIESRYLGPDSGRLPDGRDAPDAAQRNAYDEGLELAARIAHRASRGIGGGA